MTAADRAFYASLVRQAAHAAEGNAHLYRADASHLREAARRIERDGRAARVGIALLAILIGGMIAIFSGVVHRLANSPPAASIATASPAMASSDTAFEAGRINTDETR